MNRELCFVNILKSVMCILRFLMRFYLQLSDDHHETLLRIARWSVLDSTGEFRLLVGVLRGSGVEASQVNEQDIPESHGLTLVTQGNFDKLHRLPLLARRWQVCVFIGVVLKMSSSYMYIKAISSYLSITCVQND